MRKGARRGSARRAPRGARSRRHLPASGTGPRTAAAAAPRTRPLAPRQTHVASRCDTSSVTAGTPQHRRRYPQATAVTLIGACPRRLIWSNQVAQRTRRRCRPCTMVCHDNLSARFSASFPRVRLRRSNCTHISAPPVARTLRLNRSCASRASPRVRAAGVHDCRSARGERTWRAQAAGLGGHD